MGFAEAFNKFDSAGYGKVPTFDLPALLEAIGRNPTEGKQQFVLTSPEKQIVVKNMCISPLQ